MKRIVDSFNVYVVKRFFLKLCDVMFRLLFFIEFVVVVIFFEDVIMRFFTGMCLGRDFVKVWRKKV